MPIDLKPLYTVTRRDHKGKHVYAIEGEPDYQELDSVTHYTGVIDKSDALMRWAVKQSSMGIRSNLLARLAAGHVITGPDIEAAIEASKERHEEVKAAAADYGTQMHNAIDFFIKFGRWPEGLNPLIRPALDNFLRWWGDGRDMVQGDTLVASKKWRYGGAFDGTERRSSGIWIQDWKSSNSIWPEMAFQVGGGYDMAYEETFGERPAGATIVRFGKDKPEFEARDIANTDDAREAFLHCRGLRLALRRKHFVAAAYSAST